MKLIWILQDFVLPKETSSASLPPTRGCEEGRPFHGDEEPYEHKIVHLNDGAAHKAKLQTICGVSSLFEIGDANAERTRPFWRIGAAIDYGKTLIKVKSDTKVISVLQWWNSVIERAHRRTMKLEQEVHNMAQQQGRHWLPASSPVQKRRSIIITGLLIGRVPVASATSDDKKSTPTVAQTRPPIFEFKSPYDYVLLGLMVLYLTSALYLRARTRFYETGFRASYALTISMGALALIVNRDEFAAPIRSTVLEIWFPAAVHVVVQYCYDNYNPLRHILSFFGLTIIPSFILIQFPNINLLEILPPYVAIVALIIMAVHELANVAPHRYHNHCDEEHGDQVFDLEGHATQVDQLVGTHVAERSSSSQPSERLTRRNSIQPRLQMPISTVEDDAPRTTSSPSGPTETSHQP